MSKAVGSRSYNLIDYKETCNISGVSFCVPSHFFNNKNLLILRSDVVSYCYEFLSYKVGLNNSNTDISMTWSTQTFNDNTVYRETIKSDYNTTLRVLSILEANFIKSESLKVQY